MSIFQAVDRLGSLLSVLEDIANVPQDIAFLNREVLNIKATLDRAQSLATTGGQFESLRQSVTTSLAALSRLETLIEDLVAKTKREEEKGRAALKSFMWIRKKKRLNTIKQQLRDSISFFQLELSCLSL